MKIKEMTQSNPHISNTKQVIGSPLKGVDFKQQLNKASLKLENSIQKDSTLSLKEESKVLPTLGSSISGLSGLLGVQGLDQIRSQSIEMITTTLNLLEQYGKAIADFRISLKEIHPFIQALSQEISRLNTLSEKLSPTDPLKKILAEVGIVSTVEIEKFYRGDYT